MNHNPQEIAQNISSKFFLKSRGNKRSTKGSKFFRDNKIRSCSYVKSNNLSFKAVPFYDQRKDTPYQTPQTDKQSWSTSIHLKPKTAFAGMGSNKPLIPYNPLSERNRLFVANFKAPYRNTSRIEIGDRSNTIRKHYTTTYANSFISKTQQMPTSHPAILALRNKWERSRLAK